MSNFNAGGIEGGIDWYCHLNENSHFNADKEKYRKMFTEGQSASSVVLAASVAAGVLGLASSSTYMLILALPLGYGSYNINKFFGNLIEFNENPYKYAGLINGKHCIDRVAFTKLIQKDTVCFDWFINGYLEGIKNSLNS